MRHVLVTLNHYPASQQLECAGNGGDDKGMKMSVIMINKFIYFLSCPKKIFFFDEGQKNEKRKPG